jgi:hypothetical protein
MLVPLLYQCVDTRNAGFFWLLSQPLPHQVGHHLRLSKVLERISRPSCKTIYTTNTSYPKQETFLYEYPLHWVLLSTKKNRTLLFGRILLKHSRHFDYWNQPLNMRMRVCYLDCHEAGLCCYLVLPIETLLRPLQLFYCHLWPIYWLCLVLSALWKLSHWMGNWTKERTCSLISFVIASLLRCLKQIWKKSLKEIKRSVWELHSVAWLTVWSPTCYKFPIKAYCNS